jgi:lipid-binding SYLF domain-containing protein
MLQRKKLVWHIALSALSVGLVAVPSALAADPTEEVKRITESIEVLDSLAATPDTAIPKYVLDRAEAIVVIPTLVKGGFLVGAEHGKGVMSIRDRRTRHWSPPSFVKLTGGSIGWQIGLQAVDLVLVVMNREGVDDLLRSEFTLGGNASIAAGPVGRSAEASTDALMGAKILAYSRARGLFAGATLEGASLRSDDDANRRFYGREVSAKALAEGTDVPKAPPAAREWRMAVSRSVGETRASR